MAKRIFAVLISALVLGLATSQTQAQLSPIVVEDSFPGIYFGDAQCRHRGVLGRR